MILEQARNLCLEIQRANPSAKNTELLGYINQAIEDRNRLWQKRANDLKLLLQVAVKLGKKPSESAMSVIENWLSEGV